MFCKHCGKMIDDDSTFCIFCGGKLKSSETATAGKAVPAAPPVNITPTATAPVNTSADQSVYSATATPVGQNSTPVHSEPATEPKVIYVQSPVGSIFANWKNIMYVVFGLWVLCCAILFFDWFVLNLYVGEMSFSVFTLNEMNQEITGGMDKSDPLNVLTVVSLMLFGIYLLATIFLFFSRSRFMFTTGLILNSLFIAFSVYMLIAYNQITSGGNILENTLASAVLKITGAPFGLIATAVVSIIFILFARNRYNETESDSFDEYSDSNYAIEYDDDVCSVEHDNPDTWLDLSDCNLTDLSSLSLSSGLVSLFLGSNNINDISPLSVLYNLEQLDLSQNSISDISPISSLTALETLDLRQTNVRDLSPLYGLESLQTVYIDDKVSSEQIMLIQNALPKCEIIQGSDSD